MRQLGRKEEAIKHSWKQIIDYTRLTKPDYEGFKQIEIVPWNKHEVNTTSPKHISVLTVKWGTRYDAAYVNKLYGGITKHTTWHVDFYCFTDDANGLHPNIIPQQLEDGWKKWWGKATLFSSNIKGRLFYIDLDMIVTGSLDELFSYDGQFATLRTGDLSC